MKVEKTMNNACEAAVKVYATAQDVKPAADAALGMAMKNASLPGFRKGKVPKAMVQRRFAAAIAEDAQNRALRLLNDDVMKEAGIDEKQLVGIRNVENPQWSDEGFSYTLNIELHPNVSAPKYRGIEVEKKPETVTDEEVAERVETFRKAFSKYEDATEADAVGEGDFVNISFKGTVDGKGILETCPEASAVADNDDFWTQVEEGRFIPEILAALKGMKAGETKSGIAVNFGETAPDALKNKDAVYEVTVKSFRCRRLPDEETFLKEANAQSIEELTARVRENLEKEARRVAMEDRRRQVIEAMMAAAGEFDVPPSMVQRRVHERLDEMASNAQRSGLTPEYFQEHRDEILQTARTQATGQVRLAYILDAVAEAEGITVSDADVKETIEKMIASASAEKRTADEIIADLRQSGRYEGFRSQIRAEKALDLAASSTQC